MLPPNDIYVTGITSSIQMKEKYKSYDCSYIANSLLLTEIVNDLIALDREVSRSVFTHPVPLDYDVCGLKYHSIIKEPKCLLDLERAARMIRYSNVSEFRTDLNLIFSNCRTFWTNDIITSDKKIMGNI